MINEQYMLLPLVAGYRECSFLKQSTKSKMHLKQFSTLSKFQTLHIVQ